MRSRRGPTAHEVARHTRDEVRRAERSAPHEYTTAQLRTTTPGRALPQLDRVRRCYWAGNWCQAAIASAINRTFWGGDGGRRPTGRSA